MIASKFASPQVVTEESILTESNTPYLNEKKLEGLYHILDVKHKERTSYIDSFIEKLSYVPEESRGRYRDELMKYLTKQR